MKLKKARETKLSADVLFSNGHHREALTLYWHVIRDLVFLHLEDQGLPYSSTNDALSKIMQVVSKEEGENIVKAYIYGTMAEWNEAFNVQESQQLSSVLKHYLEQDAFNKVLADAEIKPRQLNLWKLRNNLWSIARQRFALSRRLKFSIFGISLTVLFLPLVSSIPINYKLAIAWSLFGLSLILSVILFLLIQQGRKYYVTAEKLRQHLFLKDIYKSEIWNEEDSHIIDSIDKPLIESHFENVSISANQDNYLEKEERVEKKLTLRLLENSFFTYVLYDRFSKTIQKDILSFLLLVIILISGSFLLVGFLAKEPESLLAPRLLFILINTIFVFDYLSYYYSFKNKSAQIKEIDLKLEKLWKIPNEKYALSIFNQYNNILWDAYPIKDLFFQNHVHNLNELVKRRFKEYRIKSSPNTGLDG